MLLFLLACAAPELDSAAPDPCVDMAGESQPDLWGGDSRLQLEATGWFRTQQVCGRWWLVTPDGHPFYSSGINAVHAHGDRDQETGETLYADAVDALYDSPEHWGQATAQRMQGWGFTTLGAWSDVDLVPLPYTVLLDLSGDDWETGEIEDLFSPEWEASVLATVEARVLPRVEDPALVGWFLDNEMKWGPDWRGTDPLLELYLELPADAPGKAAAVDLLLADLSVSQVAELTGTSATSRQDLLEQTRGWDAFDAHRHPEQAARVAAFLELVAQRYFLFTVQALRAADPNHLVLGNREVSVMTPEPVLLAAAEHVDVLSFNNYVFAEGVGEAARALAGGIDPGEMFAGVHQRVELPVLITEFGFRAADAGLPNSWPPIYPTLDTQADRAAAFVDYASAAQAAPWVVGYHWFKWADQPAGGRFDGEDNNWGVVTEGDQEYAVVVDSMGEQNAGVWGLLRQPR